MNLRVFLFNKTGDFGWLHFTRRRLNALPPYVPHCTPPKTPSPRGWKPAWESLPRGDSVLDI